MKKHITLITMLFALLFSSCDTILPPNLDKAEDLTKIKEYLVKTSNDMEVVGITLKSMDDLDARFKSAWLYSLSGSDVSEISLTYSEETMSAPTVIRVDKKLKVDGKEYPVYNKPTKLSALNVDAVMTGLTAAKAKLVEFGASVDEKIGVATCSKIKIYASDDGFVYVYTLDTQQGTSTRGRSVNTSYYQFLVTVAPDGNIEVEQN